MTAGLLVAMGGAVHDGRGRDCVAAFCALAGKQVLVIPSASQRRNPVGWYEAPFARHGASVFVLPVWSVGDANDEVNAQRVRDAGAVFLLGGAETYLLDTLLDTAVARALREAHQAGAVVGGSSAGAMYLGQWVVEDIVREKVEVGERVREPLLWLDSENAIYRGEGLLPRTVIDTHFSERHRLPRLVEVSRLLPSATCFGGDEATAAVIDPRTGGIVSVVGGGGVTVARNGAVTTYAS